MTKFNNILILTASILASLRQVLPVSSDYNTPIAFPKISLYSDEHYSGTVERFSVVSESALKAVKPLGSLVYVMALDQVKSVEIPKNTVAIVYKSEAIKHDNEQVIPDAIFKRSSSYISHPLLYQELGYSLIIESTLCDPPCSISGGICSFDKKGRPYCKCASGFTGEKCDNCLEGHYGINCKECVPITKNDATFKSCDDGIHGTGANICRHGYSELYHCKLCSQGFVFVESQGCVSCDCGTYGKCKQKVADCACVPGRSTSNPQNPCEACSTGRYKNAIDCEACWEGCKECEDISGRCTKCYDGYKIDPNDNKKCIINEEVKECPEGKYFYDDICLSCPTECNSCYNHNTCKICADPNKVPTPMSLPGYNLCSAIEDKNKVRLCMGYPTGGKLKLLESNKNKEGYSRALGVYNENKKACEYLPPGCKTFAINPNIEVDPMSPEYSSQLLLSMECTECENSYSIFIIEGRKVCRKTVCNSHTVRNYLGHCVSSGTLTPATSPSIKLWEGHVNVLKNINCEEGTYPSLYLSCNKCHPDCKTCTGPGNNSCTSCNTGILLQDSRCVRTCKHNTYENYDSGICSPCPTGCKYCSDAKTCIECNEEYTLDRKICRRSLSFVATSNRQTLILVGYASAGIAGLFFISTGVIKFVKSRSAKISNKYDNWGKRSVDSRVRVLASTGALQNIGIGTDITYNPEMV